MGDLRKSCSSWGKKGNYSKFLLVSKDNMYFQETNYFGGNKTILHDVEFLTGNLVHEVECCSLDSPCHLSKNIRRLEAHIKRKKIGTR
jgi:hypothetical protein